MDYAFVIPPGVGIDHGDLSIWTNTVDPQPADADWTASSVEVHGRAIYATLAGGVPGVDYQLRWVAHDTEGNVWPRTGLVLCALTS
jgi:hypothetical protein